MKLCPGLGAMRSLIDTLYLNFVFLRNKNIQTRARRNRCFFD